ncbi:MAG TPA: hypothetical protein VGC80_05385, partial [Acetobacteraceae bacterium]
EAITRLGANFAALHDSLARQRGMLAAVGADGRLAAAEHAALRAGAADTEAHARAMVTGLQFEDMTSQLIAHAERRVAGLRMMLSTLGDSAPWLADHDDAGLAAMNEALAAQSRELSGSLMKSVGQRHLQCGDMELF